MKVTSYLQVMIPLGVGTNVVFVHMMGLTNSIIRSIARNLIQRHIIISKSVDILHEVGYEPLGIKQFDINLFEDADGIAEMLKHNLLYHHSYREN